MTGPDPSVHLLQNLTNLYEQVAAGVLVTDLRRRIIYCNSTLAGFFGYPPNELNDKPAATLDAEGELHAESSAILRHLQAGQAWQGLFGGRCANGRQRLFHLHAVLLAGHDGTPIIVETILPQPQPGTINLRDDQDKCQALLSDIPEAILIFDAETFKVLEVNETALARYGYTREEWRDMTVLQIRPPSEADRALDAISFLKKHGLSQPVSTTHLRKDGSTFPVEVYGRLHKQHGRDIIVAVCVDITARIKTEYQRRSAQQRFHNLIEHSTDGIITVDADLRLTSVNPAFEKLVNRTSESLIGLCPWDMPGELPVTPRGRQLALLVFQTGEPQSLEGEYHYANRKVFLNVRMYPLRDPDGNVSELVAVARDVTHQRQLESELAQAHQIRTLGRMATGIAHEFNNLLACVQGNLDLALMNTLDFTSTQQCLSDARAAAVRASDRIREILVVTRQAFTNLRVVRLQALLNDAVPSIREFLPRSVRLSCSVPADLWPVLVDPSQMQQSLMSLCHNAREAMPSGGTLCIAACNETITQQYVQDHPSARPGKFVRISVADTGAGIEPSLLDKVFQPFFTTKPPGLGVGLGLTVVKSIVDQAKGWVELTSDIYKGTTFSMLLPAEQQ